MQHFYIDIETVKTQRQDYIDRIADTIEAPGQYKKPESIAKWMEENRESAIDEKLEKTVFNGGLCQIVQINYGDDTGDYVLQSDDEPALLKGFFDRVNDAAGNCNNLLQFIGHDELRFDMRVLKQRSIVLGLTLPTTLRKAANAKPWDDCVFDTMIEWAGFGNRVSLDDLCYYLGIGSPKDGFSGADFGPAWFAGERDKCEKYGYEELRALREVHNRLAVNVDK